LGDDSVGIRVARMLRRLALGKGVTILALPELDLSLIEAFEGARGVILVDALRSGKPPGTVSKYSVSAWEEPPVEIPALHGLRLKDVVGLANEAGLLGCPVIIIGVEPRNCRPGGRVSREVSAALPRAVNMVVDALDEFGPPNRGHSPG